MGLRDDLVYLDERIKTEDKTIEALARTTPAPDVCSNCAASVRWWPRR